MSSLTLPELVSNKEFEKIPWDKLQQEDLLAKDSLSNTFMLYAAHHWVWRRIPRNLVDDKVLRVTNSAGVCPLDRIVHNIADKEDLKDFKSLLPVLSIESLEYLKGLGFGFIGKLAAKEKKRMVRKSLESNSLEL